MYNMSQKYVNTWWSQCYLLGEALIFLSHFAIRWCGLESTWWGICVGNWSFVHGGFVMLEQAWASYFQWLSLFLSLILFFSAVADPPSTHSPYSKRDVCVVQPCKNAYQKLNYSGHGRTVNTSSQHVHNPKQQPYPGDPWPHNNNTGVMAWERGSQHNHCEHGTETSRRCWLTLVHYFGTLPFHWRLWELSCVIRCNGQFVHNTPYCACDLVYVCQQMH